jgi:3-hydroxyacyl-CoA dehydrogenase
MSHTIKRVAVLGAGVMGRGIAAVVAGAGIPVELLDIVPPHLSEEDKAQGLNEGSLPFRNKFALGALDGLKNSKPALIYSKRDLKKINPGNFDDDIARLADCDWIVEVVLERIDVKRSVFEKIEPHIKDTAIISSNTSGIPLSQMTEGRSDKFIKNFLITHFFNPVRYMKLLEIVSGPQTDQQAVTTMAEFMEEVLGKGVVYAKDTPNFIANRLAVYGFCETLQFAIEEGYTIEEVDKVLGKPVGRPKSATFRTADLVGVDTLSHVANTAFEQCPNDEKKNIFNQSFLKKMVEKGHCGDKTKQGFFKMTTNAEGQREILALDLKTMEYRLKQNVKFESLSKASKIKDPAKRIKFLCNADDRAGALAWVATRDLIVYAANRVPEVADDVVNVDNAIRWGFNWDLGPFELWDALGLAQTAKRLEAQNIPVPGIVQRVLEKGDGRFYKKENGQRYYFDVETGTYKIVPTRDDQISLGILKDKGTKTVAKNNAASLWDLGDGVLGLEFHSKMNAIDDGIVDMMMKAVDEAEQNFEGIVINNEGSNFSVGANLMLIWLEAQQKNWKRVEQVVRGFQNACMKLRYSKKPTVAAPFQMALGGGAEVCLGADRIQAHAETYFGLVEVGVGLIPAGGGCKEMVLRGERAMQDKNRKFPVGKSWWTKIPDGGPFQKAQFAFQTVGFAKVATSAKEAQESYYFLPEDRITMNRDNLLRDAKARVLEMTKDYQAPEPREDIMVAGKGGQMALHAAIGDFVKKGDISEHDATIAKRLARILTGGDRQVSLVSEQDLLDLELEAFLELLGMQKTQERMQHMLTTGKPLRN